MDEYRKHLKELFYCSDESPIYNFGGKFSYLSNFHECSVPYEGVIYKSSEHAYMAQKTLCPSLRAKIQNASSPAQAKKYGRAIELRPGWEDIKAAIMYDIVYSKFSNNKSLKALLLATGNRYLEEGNYWKDVYWGVCNEVGLNALGQILMLVREKLRYEQI